MKTKPRKGKLWGRFFSRKRFDGNVVLNFMRFPKGELAAYGQSYHEAAQHLVKRMATSHYRDPDAYPVVFLYRHAIELYLKAVIHWGNGLLRLNGKRTVPHKNIFTEHRLMVLVKSVRPILKFQKSLDNWDDSHFGSFHDVEKMIKELDEFDPRSYSFRYPITTKGQDALRHHFVFNVIAFGEKFDRLLRVLDGMATMVYENLQSQAESQYELQQMAATAP
jgi:hypothetical protein